MQKLPRLPQTTPRRAKLPDMIQGIRMNAPTRLLVATDLSAPSRHAAQRAALLASQSGGSLLLVHVLESGALVELRRLLGNRNATLESQIRAQAHDALAQLASDIRLEYGIDADTEIVQGAVIDSIAAHIERLGSDLLVIGARGASYMRQWLLGATAERLLRKTRLPILFVRHAPHTTAYQRMLIPVDFSPWSARAIDYARQIAPQAQIILLHASTLPFEGKMRFAGVQDETILQYRQASRRDALSSLQKLATQSQLAPDQWQPVVTQGDPGQNILEQQEELDVELIVMGKHGAGMTADLLLGSVTQQVLGQARSDVLVIAR